MALIRWPLVQPSAEEFVVIFVCSYPNPFNAALNFVSQCPKIIAHTNGKAITATREFLEIKRWMMRVFEPEPVVYRRQPLNGFRQ